MECAPVSAATLLQAQRAHAGEVACLDARAGRLATGGGDRALRGWRWRRGAGWAAAGEARAAHRYGVTALRWAPAGALLASGGVDGAVRLWGPALVARGTLAAPGAAAVRALCWAGGRLLAGHDDGALCVWAPAARRLLARLAPHEAALHALAAPMPPGHALLLTACTDGVLKVFDLAEVCASGVAGEGGRAPAPLQWVDGAHDLGALCADASEAGAAATGGHDALVRVWLPAAGAGAGPLRAGPVLQGHTAAVTALRWARGAGEALLASASLDRTARVWAPARAACLLAVPAHPRYLTSVALDPDLRYMVTGSNDKTFRMWSLGELTIEDELEPPCAPLEHFALGDLEGIGPVDEDGLEEAGDAEGAGEGAELGSGASLAWSARAHAGPINCIASCGDLLATASSDGSVRVWRWLEEEGRLREEHAVRGEGGYPALAVDFGAGGSVLLAGGLDGEAALYDVRSGVAVRALVVPGGRGGDAGGGGVRGARLSPHRAPLALLATDDGLAPLWRLTDPDPHPVHVYAAHADAATCCAWSADGRAAATGAAGGDLRLYAPPAHRDLHHEPRAHDLGVLSCDFAPPCAEISLPEDGYLLATGGSDALVKLWLVRAGAEPGAAELRRLAAHGGAVAAVRWGAGGVLATAGADRWARVWRVSLAGGALAAEPAAAVPVRGAGGAPAVALAAGGALLAVGGLAGELALWRLRAAAAPAPEEGLAPRLWGAAAAARWLREYVLDAPGAALSPAARAAAERRVLVAGLSGARLLDDPLEELLDALELDDTEPVGEEGATRVGYEADAEENDAQEARDNVGEAGDDVDEAEEYVGEAGDDVGGAGDDVGEAEDDIGGAGDEAGAAGDEAGAAGAGSALRRLARVELEYLRAPPPSHEHETRAPHALRCPLSHRLLVWPARAADGFSYERAALAEWRLAAGAVSPVSGRALREVAAPPNRRLLAELRAYRARPAPPECAEGR